MQGATAKLFKKMGALVILLAPEMGTTVASAENQTLALGSFGGRPVVEVLVNDQGPYPFILDTGAKNIIIDATLAFELNLTEVGKAQTGAPGNLQTMDVPIFNASSVSVGGFEIADNNLTGMDLSMLGNAPGTPRGVFPFWSLGDGLISLSLSQNQVTVDPEGSLKKGENGAVELNSTPPTLFPEFAIELSGKTFMAHLDTGSPGAITLPLEWKDRLSFSDEPKVVGKAVLMGEEREVWMATLEGTAKIGAIEVENPKVMLLERIPGANIGSQFLRNAVIEVDQANGLIRISPLDQD